MSKTSRANFQVGHKVKLMGYILQQCYSHRGRGTAVVCHEVRLFMQHCYVLVSFLDF